MLLHKEDFPEEDELVLCTVNNIQYHSVFVKLDEYGIAASSGSACTSGSLSSSHILKAMGIPFTFIHCLISAIRHIPYMGLAHFEVSIIKICSPLNFSQKYLKVVQSPIALT